MFCISSLQYDDTVEISWNISVDFLITLHCYINLYLHIIDSNREEITTLKTELFPFPFKQTGYSSDKLHDISRNKTGTLTHLMTSDLPSLNRMTPGKITCPLHVVQHIFY